MRIIKSLIIPLTFFGFWCIGSALGSFNEFLLPSPLKVYAAGLELLRNGILLPNIYTSLCRVLIGFFITVAVAFPLGILVGLNRRAQELLIAPLDFLRHIPPLALTPLLILWCGIGEASKLSVIILATFFPIFLNTVSGVSHCDSKLIEVGKVMGLSHMAIIRRIILPASMPSIMTGLRLGLGFSWRALIGAELLAAASGLGYMIIDAEQFSRTDIVIVGILSIGMLGYAMDLAFLWISKRIMPWQKEFTTNANY